jgi:hypothetical protein
MAVLSTREPHLVKDQLGRLPHPAGVAEPDTPAVALPPEVVVGQQPADHGDDTGRAGGGQVRRRDAHPAADRSRRGLGHQFADKLRVADVAVDAPRLTPRVASLPITPARYELFVTHGPVSERA